MSTRRRLAILVAAVALFTPTIAASSATAASCTSVECSPFVCPLACALNGGGSCIAGVCQCKDGTIWG
jgi:hypothetical protein